MSQQKNTPEELPKVKQYKTIHALNMRAYKKLSSILREAFREENAESAENSEKEENAESAEMKE